MARQVQDIREIPQIQNRLDWLQKFEYSPSQPEDQIELHKYASNAACALGTDLVSRAPKNCDVGSLVKTLDHLISAKRVYSDAVYCDPEATAARKITHPMILRSKT